MIKPITILSTRRLQPDEAVSLTSAGLKVDHFDFIKRTVTLPVKREIVHHNIALTSQMAVEGWIALAGAWQLQLKDYRFFCISGATSKAAQEQNLLIAGTGDNAEMLAEAILLDSSVMEVTFLGGNRRLDILPEKLRGRGVEVNELEVYRTELVPVELIPPFDAVIFFSPSGVESYLKATPYRAAAVFCIGNTTGSYAREHGFSNVLVSPKPNMESLIGTILHFYSNHRTHA